MPDQATKIRGSAKRDSAFASKPVSEMPQRIIAVTSGKGGVGKSNVAVNLAIALTRFGHRVLVVDADFGMANVDLIMGLTPRYNLSHVFSGKKELADVMLTGPGGVRILPSASGGRRGDSVDRAAIRSLFDSIRETPETADLVFVDTGAEITDNAVDLLCLADEVLLLTTPEPTSIMDAYGVVKLLARERENAHIRLLVNMAEDPYDAQHVVDTMRQISKQFFNVTLEDLGWLYQDPSVSRAVRQQQPFVLLFPASRAARSLQNVAVRFANLPDAMPAEHGFRGVVNRILSHFL